MLAEQSHIPLDHISFETGTDIGYFRKKNVSTIRALVILKGCTGLCLIEAAYEKSF